MITLIVSLGHKSVLESTRIQHNQHHQFDILYITTTGWLLTNLWLEPSLNSWSCQATVILCPWMWQMHDLFWATVATHSTYMSERTLLLLHLVTNWRYPYFCLSLWSFTRLPFQILLIFSTLRYSAFMLHPSNTVRKRMKEVHKNIAI